MKHKIRFRRVNERHHTVAIASVNHLPINTIRTRVQHINVQVATLDDMVSAWNPIVVDESTWQPTAVRTADS